ncbi:hypothetical protein SEA_ARCHERNM_77 [Mycobacterium phage ArcherNM]|uniref:hypothetical protein n=1 Tax=Mycobacterium phage ArcherNM TaxID=1815972 RepID=UPI00078BCBFD|nr:hypothetical protein BJD71_gp77 [Mycobacterium phage ArcherNM]AMS01071.1 hypothetical protein SEA_ARCHERNM_77 [Mycobacterium phage ArcherNM]
MVLLMRFKARCTGCTTKFEAEKRRDFGTNIRIHEVMTGHTVKTKFEEELWTSSTQTAATTPGGS